LRALFQLAELRAFLVAAALAGLAESALAVLLGVHVYEIAHDPLNLGWLGLVEAVPAIGLVLVGGAVADRAPRRDLAAGARGVMAVLVAVLALAAPYGGLPLIYGVAFLIGAIRAFEEPSVTGLEAEILPRVGMLHAVSLVAAVSRVSTLAGPVLGGVLFAAIGPAGAYALVACCLAAAALTMRLAIPARPAPPIGAPGREGMFGAIMEGLRYVFTRQVIVGSMALDLFAVFFGGVAGLLPVFADDILHTGPAGVGWLRAAASAGALAAMLVATRHPPRGRAGVVLHLAIAGFGLGIIVFAFSRSLALSMAALAFAGGCDGIGVVIRRAIVRLAAPDALRGRVAAVRGLFLNASNELGDFESGVAASLLGAVPAVWLGGVITLAVVAVTAWRAPKLRRLDLRAMENGRS
jgi:MFS family permease